MLELHGTDWAFPYTEKEWEAIKNEPDRTWNMETKLEPVYCDEEYEKFLNIYIMYNDRCRDFIRKKKNTQDIQIQHIEYYENFVDVLYHENGYDLADHIMIPLYQII
jgi:hypothetical protein